MESFWRGASLTSQEIFQAGYDAGKSDPALIRQVIEDHQTARKGWLGWTLFLMIVSCLFGMLIGGTL